MKRLQYLLESKYASAACIIFAIANRIIFTTLYSSIGRDTRVQLTYAENMLAGKGMGVTKYFTTNVDHGIFDTYQLFPPGFTFTIIPLLKLFNGDEYRAVLASDIIAAILFIISIRVLCKQLGLPLWMKNTITLISGCTQYSFFMSFSSTDAISLSLVLFSLAAITNILIKRNQLGMGKVIGIGFLFFLPALFRYMYLPVVVLIPFLVFCFGIYSKNKHLKITGLKLTVATVFFLMLVYALTASVNGNAIYLYNVGRGFYFDQLIHWYPFIPGSFINIDFASQLASRIPGINYSQVFSFLEILNVTCYVLLTLLLIRYFIFNNSKQHLSRQFIFIASGSVISVIIILMLAYLSFTYKAQDWGEYQWTYNKEIRYFAFLYVFILLAFFVTTYYYPAVFKKWSVKIVAFVIILSIVTESLHGVYYNAKIIIGSEDQDYIRNGDKNYRSFSTIISDLKKQHPGVQIMVCSPDQFYLHTAAQLDCKSIFDYANLNKADIRTNAKSILILAVHVSDTWIMNEYIQKHKPQLRSIVAGTAFYTEEINPQ